MKTQTLKLNLKFSKYQSLANGICKQFQKRGFDCFWAGGSVRDLMLARQNPDIDLATSAKPVQIKNFLSELGYKFYNVGEKFGTIGAITDKGNIEITTFRAESDYSDFRHPSKIKFIKSAEQDAKRRDLTINGLMFNPASQQIMDYVGGLQDLEAKKISFIPSAATKIRQDPLRMLRAIRFAVQLDFEIDQDSFQQIKKNAKLISKISGERIKSELDKIFLSPNYASGVHLLDRSGLLKELVPEVDNLKGVKQSKDFHAEGNAFKHTLRALELAKDLDLDLRYAILFHDIGKAITAKKELRAGREHISFHGHGGSGAQMFAQIAKRLRFGRNQAKKIEFLLKHHMDLLHIQKANLKTLVKWAKNKDFGDLIRLRIVDTAGSLMTDKQGNLVKKDLNELRRFYKRWQKLNALVEKNLLSGNEIMQLTGFKPGPRIGIILEQLKRLQIQGKIKNKVDAKKHLLRSLAVKK